MALFLVRMVFGSLNTPPVPTKLPKLFADSSSLGMFSRLNFEWTSIIALLLTIIVFFFL